MSIRLLRRPEVETRTGLSRSSIYAMMERGAFPHDGLWTLSHSNRGFIFRHCPKSGDLDTRFPTATVG